MAHYIWLTATCVADALGVEQAFTRWLGTDGGISNNGDKAVSTNAYKKSGAPIPSRFVVKKEVDHVISPL